MRQVDRHPTAAHIRDGFINVVERRLMSVFRVYNDPNTPAISDAITGMIANVRIIRVGVLRTPIQIWGINEIDRNTPCFITVITSA
jgi:hypothetical protein